MITSRPRLISAGRFAGSRDCPWHAHEGHEIVLVESGSCSISCGDAVLDCPTGSLAVLPRGLPQYQRSPGAVRTCYAVWQSGDAVLAPAPRVLRLDAEAGPARWLADLCDLAAGADPDPTVLDGLLMAVLSALRGLEASHARDATMHPALAEASRLVAADLAAPLDLGTLARRVGISASHLVRLFRRHHGAPPLRWQHALRLRLAERLLQDPMLTVGEVGRRCGWDDLNYFCRVFRRHAGAPPAIWRGARAVTRTGAAGRRLEPR